MEIERKRQEEMGRQETDRQKDKERQTGRCSRVRPGQSGLSATHPPPSPTSVPCPPHRGLPANVVHSHGHVLHHMETLTSHCDGPATAVGTASPISPPAARGARPAWGPGSGSHLTGLRRGLMAMMTGFRMYRKVRLPRTQPWCSKRTHTGTGAGRVPPGTVQVMLESVRLWEGSRLGQQGPHFPLLAPA